LKLLKRTRTAGRPACAARGIQALVLLALMMAVPAIARADGYLRLKALVIVYPNTFADTATPSEVANVRAEVAEAVQFIWRSSRMRLHLAVDDLTIYRYVPEHQFTQPEPGRYVLPYWAPNGENGSVTDDLAELGYPSGSYDIVVAFYAFQPGPGRRNYFGAGSYGVNSVLGKAGFITIPMTWAPKTLNGYFEHEFLHVLSDMFNASGATDFPLVHNGDFYRFVNGENASYEKWLLGSLSDADYLAPGLRWGSVRTFKDNDGDGVPDYSPYGDELSITEESLGSSSDFADTDGDGLSDLDEAIAGVRSGTDPNNPDTDGDGLIDGIDPDPLVASEPEAP